MSSERLEERLRSVLADQAMKAGHPSFTGVDAVWHGRAARRRRRTAGLAGGVVAAVVAALLFGAALLKPDHRALPPAHPSTAPVPQELQPQLGRLPVGEPVGSDLLLGNELATAEGKRVRIPLPPQVAAVRASRVPSGWVIQAGEENGGDSIWFLSRGGELRQLVANGSPRYAIATDGRRVAVADNTSTASLKELPSGRVLAHTRYEAGFGPMIAGMVGDRVLLEGVQGGGPPTDLAVWNVTTNRITAAAAPMPRSNLRVADLTADGRAVVLTTGGEVDGKVCLTAVPFDERLRAGHLVCGSVELDDGHVLSPRGTTAVVRQFGRVDLATAAVAELRDGRLRPVPLAVPAHWDAFPVAWEDEQTVIVGVRVPRVNGSDGSRDRYVLLRCRTDGRTCERVPLPVRDLPAYPVVPRYGG